MRFCLLFIVLFASVFIVNIFSEEPWSISKNHPVTTEVYKKYYRPINKKNTSLSGIIISSFQKYISPLDGSSCHYLPTCSRYSAEAIDKYGSIKGTFMTIDRIIRCHDGQQEHYFDPVKNY